MYACVCTCFHRSQCPTAPYMYAYVYVYMYVCMCVYAIVLSLIHTYIQRAPHKSGIILFCVCTCMSVYKNVFYCV